MHIHPAPAPRDLLPPLLACLPTAFISPRPPPALLPLLSPILRQRVNLLSSTVSTGTGGWLPLLSWDLARASKLGGKVEGMQLEAHPVSGELELQEIERIQYRKLDQETLQARFEVEEFELLPVYVWCDSDDQGAGPGWKLTELRTLEDMQDGTLWFDSELQATEAASQSQPAEALDSSQAQPQGQTNDADDDDDYWASYDQTPGRTPARTPAKRSPAPNTHAFASPSASQPSAEDDYYARYATEVQPALDSHDPEEEHTDAGDSTLHGDSLIAPQARQPEPSYPRPDSVPAQRSLFPADDKRLDAPIDSAVVSSTALPQSQHNLHNEPLAPRPTSPSSTASSRSVQRLEQGAVDMTRAEVGVKQHIASEVKNLFRLAQSVGIDREEFDRIVRTQIDVLALMEESQGL